MSPSVPPKKEKKFFGTGYTHAHGGDFAASRARQDRARGAFAVPCHARWMTSTMGGIARPKARQGRRF